MLILVALLLSGPEIPATMDPAASPDYQVLREDLAVAGQPTAEALGRLKEQGFRTVIDLCPEGQGLAGERLVVEAQGLRYVWIPIAAEGLRKQSALAVDHVINEPGASPFLLHGSSIDSAAAVWAVLQANAGKSQEEALQEGGKAGLKSDVMIAAVRQVLEVPDGTRPPSGVIVAYDQPPRMIKNARPQYPQEAFDKKIQGVVELELLIDATGRVVRARVIKSIPLLDEAAIQCTYLWQFSPAIKDGRPVATRANAPVTFRIFGEKEPKPAKVPTVIEWVNQFKKDAAAMNRDLIVPEASRLGVQGSMEVEFTVKGDGSLSRCRIFVSSGSKELDKTVQKGVCSHRFAPIPAEKKVMIERARFRLNESEGGDPKALQGRDGGASGLPLGTGQRMGPLFFDPMGADFTTWLQPFKTEVYRNWIMPQAALQGAKGHVDIEFTVERAGSLSQCRVLISSGKPELDKAAKYSLESSQFLALPSDYHPNSVTMRVSFFYNEGQTH